MSITTAAALVEELRQNRLLPTPQLDELLPEGRAPGNDARHLARQLVQRGWLTPYQINQLFQGRGQTLVLGQYVLLERLGEGGMGQVFKARQQRLNRLVALKVIRKDRADHPDVVRRFLREVQAVAQLSHPNIVLAFDADQIGSTYFIAMEYIDGIDLDRFVKMSGPLPVDQACSAIHQAARGLAHAHAHGMVHRDIKPSNLILARTSSPGDGLGTVKVLDLGLARLHFSDESDAPSCVDLGGGPLTRPGMMIGTPDYVAPEQALDAHSADIRADLYSLGCTLHYLLIGQPPFPGGKPLEKLIRHRCETVTAVEQLRPEVPPEVGAVVRRLLAKNPQDRYQTPAELADVLAALPYRAAPTMVSDATVLDGEVDTFQALIAAVSTKPIPPAQPAAMNDPNYGAPAPIKMAIPMAEPVHVPIRKRRRLFLLGTGGLVLLAGLVLLGFLAVRLYKEMGRRPIMGIGQPVRTALVTPDDRSATSNASSLEAGG